MPENKEVKIYGLKRTGTNYVTLLLRRNYRLQVHVNKGGWKHGLYRCRELLGRPVNALVVVKHPLPWLVSMYRYQSAWNHFGNFVKKEDQIVAWNVYGAYWQTMQPSDFKVVFIRFDDIVGNPGEACGRVAAELGLERKTKKFSNVRNYVKPGEKISTKKFDGSFYTEQRYMRGYRQDLIKFVAERIDPYVLDGFGYPEIEYER